MYAYAVDMRSCEEVAHGREGQAAGDAGSLECINQVTSGNIKRADDGVHRRYYKPS
jgi:hypothetical protein